MKKQLFLSFALILTLVLSVSLFHSCNDDDDSSIITTVSIDKTSTENLNIGDDVTATITIVSEGVNSVTYTKVVDNESGDPVDVTSELVESGDTSRYHFSYTLQEGDDLHTLGFEFEVIDNRQVSYTVALVVNTNLSVKSSFVKYDWHINSELWLGMDVLTEADSVKTFRFYEDGTYEVDLTPEYADSTHHFCYWVYKETPDNGDTLAIVRLIRKMYSDGAGVDEYYDFRIVSADESEMIMYWDIAVFGLFDIQRTFVSKPKGDFQPYGTAEMEEAVNNIAVLDCSTIDESLLTIE
jgi:hypothetical protein